MIKHVFFSKYRAKYGESHSQLLNRLRAITRWLPSLNYITLHYAYFVVSILFWSGIFYASSSPRGKISFVDSLFQITSAITNTGLNTIYLSDVTVWQQIILWFMFMAGSSILISTFTVKARRNAFERRFRAIVNQKHNAQVEHDLFCKEHDSVMISALNRSEQGRPHSIRPQRFGHEQRAITSPDITAVHPGNLESPFAQLDGIPHSHNVLSNERLFQLNDEERKRLKGCECRALTFLAWATPLYAILWMLLGSITMGAWMHVKYANPPIQDGANSWWIGIFLAVASFNNVGMSLLDANMIPFAADYFILVIAGLLILAGNTAYPIFVRFSFWASLKVLNWWTPHDAYRSWKEMLEFILKHPRRVSTTLFPSQHTWWLLGTVIVINTIEWLALEISNLNNPAMGGFSVATRVIAGLYQAVGE